jgi:hypothetical protein
MNALARESHRIVEATVRMRPLVVSAFVYVAITVLMGYRVIAELGSAIASDAGDPLLTTAILAWNASHVPWTDAWYQLPIFYPTHDALTLSEHLLGVSVFHAPLQWLTGNPVVAYNLIVLLTYPLCGVAMWLLVWRLTRNSAAAFLAGFAYAFAPYRAGQLAHIQVLASFWMPLALLGLHGFAETRRWRWLVLFGVAWLLQGAANGYYLVYFTLLVGLWGSWFLVARRRWRDVLRMAVAMAIAVVPLVPILGRYLTAQHGLGLSRNIGEISAYSADIAAPLCASPALTVWGWLRLACVEEGELFAGATLIGMCLIAIASGAFRADRGSTRDASRPDPRWRTLALRIGLAIAALYALVTAWTLLVGPWRLELGWLHASASSADKPATVALVSLLAAALLSKRFRATVQRGSTPTFYALAAGTCWVLSWGPFPRVFGHTMLYQAPYAWLRPIPGFDALRVPARLWMMVVLCLVVFMGLAAARLLAGRTKRATAVILVLAACGLAADGWTTIRTAEIPASVPTGEITGRTVLVLPITNLATDIAVVYHAVRQRYRSINGFSGYEPPYYQALRTLSTDRDDRLFEPFVRRGDVDVLVPGTDNALRAFVEGQPGHRLVSDGTIVHYFVPRRRATPPPFRTAGRFPIHAIDATCSNERAALASDFDLDTRWECGAQTSDQSITADLGAPEHVGGVVHALGTFGADFPRYLNIETSVDGQTWRGAWQGSPAAEVLQAAMAAPREAPAFIAFPSRTARYVRLRQTGRSDMYYWSIAELEILSGD